ncbi:MAG: NUMOD4 motif-containing HNH endonuclease [Coriobacteriia bacterium]
MDSISWAPVPGFETLYEVSTLGEVRRPHRKKTGKPGQPLSNSVHQGYPRVVLYRDGRRHTRNVHRLVALAFLGAPEPGVEVCHKDGDRMNPRLENLRWGTRSSNVLDAVRHGTNHWSNKQHCPAGHDYDEENTVLRDGSRACRACARASNRRYRARKKAAR